MSVSIYRELLHSLRVSQTRHRWQNAKGVACQHNDVLGMACDARNERVGYELYWVGSPRVLCQSVALKVEFSVPVVQFNIFNNGTKSNGVPQERLFFMCKADAFGIAATFHVEDTIVTPARSMHHTVSSFQIRKLALHQQCSSSPIKNRKGSALRVVLPVKKK